MYLWEKGRLKRLCFPEPNKVKSPWSVQMFPLRMCPSLWDFNIFSESLSCPFQFSGLCETTKVFLSWWVLSKWNTQMRVTFVVQINVYSYKVINEIFPHVRYWQSSISLLGVFTISAFDTCFQELKPLLRYQILSNIKLLGLPLFLFSQLLQLKCKILSGFIQEADRDGWKQDQSVHFTR